MTEDIYWGNVNGIIRNLKKIPLEEIEQPKKGKRITEMVEIESTIYFNVIDEESGKPIIRNKFEKFCLKESGRAYQIMLNLEGEEVFILIPNDVYNGVKHGFNEYTSLRWIDNEWMHTKYKDLKKI